MMIHTTPPINPAPLRIESAASAHSVASVATRMQPPRAPVQRYSLTLPIAGTKRRVKGLGFEFANLVNLMGVPC
jgi:hypothetical protein